MIQEEAGACGIGFGIVVVLVVLVVVVLCTMMIRPIFLGVI
jgi:hypothetical protein